MTSTSAFTCPKCSYRFRVKDKYLGKVAECPFDGCTQKMRLNPPPAGSDSGTSPSETSDDGAVQNSSAGAAGVQTANDDSAPQTTGGSSTANPLLVDAADANQNSIISVTGMSPAESRRSQRALRRRATTAPPKVEIEKKPIDPTWIGFGGVLVVAIIGWTIWSFTSEPEKIETKAPAAVDPLPIVVEGEEDQVSIQRPRAIFARLPHPAQQQSNDDVKKKYSLI